MQIQQIDFKNIQDIDRVVAHVCEVLSSGGAIVFPSDTVYGLLCDATNEHAIKTLLAFKERPAGKPISVFVHDMDQMREVVEVKEDVEQKLTTLLPGPYTVVLPSKHSLSPLLESEHQTLGVRIPDYTPITRLLSAFGRPITATSANLSSQSPHYSIRSFLNQTSQKRQSLISLVVDAGELPHNKPSTVIDYSEGDIKVLRLGDRMQDAKSFLSRSEEETKQIARSLITSEMQKQSNKPTIYLLKGEVGAGKTVFVKGIGEVLGVDRIVSPTYVMYYEYPIKHIMYPHYKTFVHADLYNLKDIEELRHLGLESYLRKGVVMCIEWGERSQELYDMMKDKADISIISFIHTDENTREITISKSI